MIGWLGYRTTKFGLLEGASTVSAGRSAIMSDSAIPWTVACQVHLSMESSRQEYWSCHSLLQSTLSTQELNSGLLLCRQILCHLCLISKWPASQKCYDNQEGIIFVKVLCMLWRQMLLPGCLKFFPEANSNVHQWINESPNEELPTTIHKTENKDLPYSTGSPTQYSAMTYMGKESKKKWVYEYILLRCFAVHRKLLQHCKSTIHQKNF